MLNLPQHVLLKHARGTQLSTNTTHASIENRHWEHTDLQRGTQQRLQIIELDPVWCTLYVRLNTKTDDNSNLFIHPNISWRITRVSSPPSAGPAAIAPWSQEWSSVPLGNNPSHCSSQSPSELHMLHCASYSDGHPVWIHTNKQSIYQCTPSWFTNT